MEQPLRILLIGYGKMGRAVEQQALLRGHTLVGIITDRHTDLANVVRATRPDVAVEFTSPQSAVANLRLLAAQKVPVVCGSTGWLGGGNWEEVSAWVKQSGGALLYASNFSVGMNLMFKLTRLAAQAMDQLPEYEIDIEEIHHVEKKDAPSGTAITLAGIVTEEVKRKTSWVANTTPTADEIGITAVREPDVPGIHTVTFSSAIDTVEITHTAHSRAGFAFGAVVAAEWLKGKKGVYQIDDMLKARFGF